MPRHWSSTTAYAFLSWVLFVSATTLEKVTQQGWCLWSPLQIQLIHTGDALEIRGFSWVVGPHFRGLTSRFLLTGPVLQGQVEGLPGDWWSHQSFPLEAWRTPWSLVQNDMGVGGRTEGTSPVPSWAGHYIWLTPAFFPSGKWQKTMLFHRRDEGLGRYLMTVLGLHE